MPDADPPMQRGLSTAGTPVEALSVNGDDDEHAAPPGMGSFAVAMVVATIVVALLNYGLNITLGWLLPMDEYGRVGVSQTLIFIGVWLISAGLPWVVARSVARAHERGSDALQRADAWRTYKTGRAVSVAVTIVVVSVLEFGFHVAWFPLEPSYAPLIFIVALTIAALGLGSVPNAGLQGSFRFGRIASLRVFEAGVNVVVSVALVVAGFGAVGALAGFAASAVLASGLSIWSMSQQGVPKVEGWGRLDALGVAIPMTLAVFGGVLLTNVDLLAIKFLSGSGNSDALSGTYQVAAVLARAPLFIAAALVATFYPRIAQASGAHEAARTLVRCVVITVLPANLILSLGAPAVVHFFYPERYAAAAPLLAVLAIGSACLVLESCLAAILQARDQVRFPAMVMSAAVAVQVVGLILAVPTGGAFAAAVVSTSAGALAVSLLLWRIRKLDVFPNNLGRQAVAFVMLAAPTAVLAWGLSHEGRPVIAVWVAASGAWYAATIFWLNLLDADQLARSTMRWSGRARRLVAPLLGIASYLNRAGKRAAWRHS